MAAPIANEISLSLYQFIFIFTNSVANTSQSLSFLLFIISLMNSKHLYSFS